ncbi:MAG: hypothetical protein JSS83_21155 [Cyanobacteria bacterium SZAS LIN-3]|nr:hypothetical protein [Cyanobacteria bacterium SZAS LIN-3]MBS2007794.1 hypothetical protein [Cyanobacteria bacterium SZAS TMP-1]
MDKLFTPNKYFVGFCAALVLIVFAWNYTRDQMLLEEAKEIGRQQAAWSWPSMGITTTIEDIDAKILKRTDNDAEIEVQGKQKIQAPADAQALAGSESNYKAILTLYKHGNSRIWLLGKVEGE